ncbi:chorismate-binding protein [Desulforhopalus singaporensis]|uniref:Para-aminobenzoate synthetase / 4-amino-4-deoxychorismate lyase n=1 Tax=Desulforhopalus singaporensis TaxID=91360 RepID=A0A1H0UNE8_9BACT|nr:chorismate-binding protein [Desulforhopalus singaporensis]SDP67767.1 para-aminobenzoate synthetase / 4-amino-4-deoxychorismate lyase [Desulforhopalus singaporensis]
MLGIDDNELDCLLHFLRHEDECVFLDTSRPDEENCMSYLFVDPIDRFVCRAGDNLEGYLQKLQSALGQGYHLAGWIGYEFGALLEGGITKNIEQFLATEMVLADLGVFLKPYTFNHHTGQNNYPKRGQRPEGCQKDCHKVSSLRPNMEKKEFVAALGTIRDYIEAGDTYQVNYTMKLLFDFDGSPEQFYAFLRKNQSVGYGAFIKSRGEQILSFSPELFFKKQGPEITVRPMKGTVAKGRFKKEEEANSHFLQNDIKNRSENVMIVDLLRNDLARLVHGHGKSRVFVQSLFDVEAYESLLQMTSTVKATIAETAMRSLPLTQLFRALFPCGSITGAPKIRTMQIIDELEKDRRGVYTGAIGYFSPDGSAAFNVPIRTIRLSGGRGEMGIGAGITHDSVAEQEWDESLLKGRFLTHCKPQFQLFETILHTPGQGYYLLDEHLFRLKEAASFFNFSFDSALALATLADKGADFTSPMRVRLELYKDGRVKCVAAPCDLPQILELEEFPAGSVADLPEVAVSDHIVDCGNQWLFYKTTRRSLYNDQYRKACERGLFDYIFFNSHNELTEGCITNVIIYHNGRYKTPPVECGLLAGVMRGKLLAGSKVPVIEQKITPEMLRNAEAVYVCNSVRGVVRVRLRG